MSTQLEALRRAVRLTGPEFIAKLWRNGVWCRLGTFLPNMEQVALATNWSVPDIFATVWGSSLRIPLLDNPALIVQNIGLLCRGKNAAPMRDLFMLNGIAFGRIWSASSNWVDAAAKLSAREPWAAVVERLQDPLWVAELDQSN